jgi:L-histidine N-alpha-methyltransferase
MTPRSATDAFLLDRHLAPADQRAALRRDVLTGLLARPKWLPPKWFYDDVGSALFDQITRLPEYYPTARERQILTARAGEIAALTGATTLVELGSGSAEKTTLLLDALRAAGGLARYVPFDVSEAALLDSAGRITARYPGVAVHAVLGDFERHLDRLPRGPGRLVVFLGGTIGNLVPDERARFLAGVAAGLDDGALLLGTDLVKGTSADRSRLVRAYDDAAGVTARFNRNVLAVLNRELDADFDLDAFEHVARFDEAEQWIEMRLHATRRQVVRVAGLGLDVTFAAGEQMRTEISAKFTRARVAAEYARAGLRMLRWWTDPDGDYALSLAVRA